MINDKTTKELEHILEHTDSVRQLADVVDKSANMQENISFADYFLSLKSVQSIGNAEIVKRSGINRNYAYQILNGTRPNPSQDKVIRLSLAGELNLDETQRALIIAKAPVLYPRIRRDSILIFCINKSLDVMDTNELLFSFHEEVLH